MIGEPVTKFNHKSIQRHSPVLNRHRPFFRSLRNGQVNHLTRRLLAEAGLPPSRFYRIEGVADTVPYVPNNPADPRNRRISITVLYQDESLKK